MIVVGIDPSLNGTGLARWRDSRLVETKRISFKSGALESHYRMEKIEDAVVQFLFADGTPDLVAIEGPSFASKSSTYHEMAGGWWIVAHRVWEEGIPLAIVPPGSAKKYATDNGNAGKKLVQDAVLSRLFRTEVRPMSEDECDAVVIGAMAQRWAGSPVDSVPEERWPLLDGCQWPQEIPA